MVSADFKVRYQSSVLGYMWSLLKPLFMFLILYVVFTSVFKLGKGVPHYPVYLLFGIVLWNFFTEATMVGSTSIVASGDLIRKISIPRYLVVIASSTSALINLALNLVVVMIFVVFTGIHPMLTWLIFIPLLLELYILAQAVAFFLSALYVRFRDINYIWELVIQAGFYATPIIYALSLVPLHYQKLMMLNPVAQIIQDSRYSLVTHASVTGWSILRFPFSFVPLVAVLVIAVLSMLYFKHESKTFAENI